MKVALLIVLLLSLAAVGFSYFKEQEDQKLRGFKYRVYHGA